MDSGEGDRVNYDSEDFDDNDEEEQLVESFCNKVTDNSAQKNYKILKEEEIKKLQEEDISDVINVLSVSRSVACTLLCQHRWNRSSVYESWFNRDAETKPSSPNNKEEEDCCRLCGIKITLSADCGHLFCHSCWETHINLSENQGPGCLVLTCPEPGCESLPNIDKVDDIDEYYNHLYQSYVDSSASRKWCPNLSCGLAVEFDESSGEVESYDVTCDCGYKSCWSCGKEGHTPLDCETVAKWVQKNKNEADSVTWILAHTKPCPKCERPIQNEGRYHVTCGDPCGYEFCWRCCGRWESNWHFCSNGAVGGSESREKMEKYAHCYERWVSNDEASKEALGEMYTARNEQVEREGETMFVVEAWEQVVECRRVLKWSYAYGYYLWESGSGRLDLFEHLQKEAESAVKTLEGCAEERGKYYNSFRDLNESRVKLMDLTWVTRKHLNNLVRALE